MGIGYIQYDRNIKRGILIGPTMGDFGKMYLLAEEQADAEEIHTRVNVSPFEEE